METPLKPQIHISDIEVILLMNFTNTLKIIENYDRIDDIKNYIKIRIEELNHSINFLQTNQKELTFYGENAIQEILKTIRTLLQENESNCAIEYIDILLRKLRDHKTK